MVSVRFSPNAEVIIHEVIEEESSNFFEEIVRQMLGSPVHVQPTVNWIDGIAFVVSPMPSTDDVIKENLVGRIHFAAVLFTRAQFQTQVTVKLNNQEFSVRLRKANANPTLVEVVRFLQTFKKN